MPIYKQKIPTWECRVFEEGIDGRINIGGWAVANGISVVPQDAENPEVMEFIYFDGSRDTAAPGMILQLDKNAEGHAFFILHDPSEFYREFEQVNL